MWMWFFRLRCKTQNKQQNKTISQYCLSEPGTAHRRRNVNHRHIAIHPGSCASEKAFGTNVATRFACWQENEEKTKSSGRKRHQDASGCTSVSTILDVFEFMSQIVSDASVLPRYQLKPAGHGLICFSFSRMACCLACSKRTRSSSSQNLNNLK